MAKLYWKGLGVSLVFLCLTGCGTWVSSSSYHELVGREIRQTPQWVNAPQSKAGQAVALNQLIDSDQLKHWVGLALDANPGLQQALLTLQIRQAELRQVDADQAPVVTAGYGATQAENTKTYTGSVSVSWEIDLWQRLNDAVNAQQASVEEQKALYTSAKNSLVAEVMSLWLQQIYQSQVIQIENARLAAYITDKQVIEARYRNGTGTLNDFKSALSAEAASRASLVSEEEVLKQLQRSTAKLLGQHSTRIEPAPIDYPQVLYPLVSLPDQTMAGRPDLQAAYQAILQADFETKVAYKALLPSINIQAALEDVANSPSSALLTNPAWTLLSQLTAPLFDGGKLKSAQEVAELTGALAYQTYREKLLSAVAEVENALGQETALDKQQQQIQIALDAARNSQMQYEQGYRSGTTDIRDLLSTQQQTYDLEQQLNSVQFSKLNNRITLGLALGLGIQS